ncbi:MAG: hypothetical protein R2769_14180 [Saprospiraceae bacterium]
MTDPDLPSTGFSVRIIGFLIKNFQIDLTVELMYNRDVYTPGLLTMPVLRDADETFNGPVIHGYCGLQPGLSGYSTILDFRNCISTN